MQFGVKRRGLALNLPPGGGLQECSFRPRTVNGSRTRAVVAPYGHGGVLGQPWGLLRRRRDDLLLGQQRQGVVLRACRVTGAGELTARQHHVARRRQFQLEGIGARRQRL